jgi:hypothetical protein
MLIKGIDGMKIRKYLIMSIILLLNIAYAKTDCGNLLLRGVLDSEYVEVEKLYNDCMIGSCYGDSTYYTSWYIGLKYERDCDYYNANEQYGIALKYNRFEMGTYEIYYSIGRLELSFGKCESGKNNLLKFISGANADLTNDEPIWGFTEVSAKELNEKIDMANALIKKIKVANKIKRMSPNHRCY